jgi:DNA-binding transcriptional LysR family regulator
VATLSRGRREDAPTYLELRVFVAVAEELHFGHAAKRLGVSQSVVSETIRRLEDRLECVLFERTTRHVGLSESGTLLLERAREIVARFDALLSEASPHNGSSPASSASPSASVWRNPLIWALIQIVPLSSAIGAYGLAGGW